MSRSIPLEKALDDCMVVYAMNGKDLPAEHGGPLRLLVPGYQGNMSVKWLRRLKLGDQPWYTREETSMYTDLLANGKARQGSFVMDAKSVITTPSPQGDILSKGQNMISGFAWSGRGKIARVDVSVDGGRNWFTARIEGEIFSKAWVRFSAIFDWSGQEMVIMSRALDETGYVQPSLQELVALRGTNSFYHNNAIQPWRIRRNGNVENV
jgi:sulfane dehydrogenase subunit SoxC